MFGGTSQITRRRLDRLVEAAEFDPAGGVDERAASVALVQPSGPQLPRRVGSVFFAAVGLSLEGGLNRLAGEFAAGRDGEDLNRREDSAIGCVVGGLFELLGPGERVFDEQGLQRRLGAEGDRIYLRILLFPSGIRTGLPFARIYNYAPRLLLRIFSLHAPPYSDKPEG